MADHTCGDEEESGALQLSLPEDVRNSQASALTLRNNVSLWYELLDPSKLMPLLRDRFEFTDAQVKEVESYHDHPRAQAAAILFYFFKPNVKLHIPSLCTSIQSLEGTERLSSRMIKDYQYYKGTQQRELPIRSNCQTEDSKLSEPFLKLLRDVIGHLSDYPNALDALKKGLDSLVYPLGNGKVVPLVEMPPLCRDACTVEEFFTSISPNLNPLSLHFLQCIVGFIGCGPAISAVAAFNTVRVANSHLLLCSNRWEVTTSPDGLNDLNTSARSDAEVAHTAPLVQLKSVHPWVFARLPEHRAAELSRDCVRLSIRVNKKSISLADYDCLLTTICGYFLLPECAFTYVGCTEQPLCLTWFISKTFLQYLEGYFFSGISGECMLAMQGVVNIMIGDKLNYKCLNSKECKLRSSSFYGLVDRLKVLTDEVDVNCRSYNGATPLMLAKVKEVAQVLLDAGAIKDIQDMNGNTALFYASNEGVVQLLVDAGANKDIQNEHGSTALIIACKNGYDKVVQLLIDAGANKDIQNKDGDICLTLASLGGHEKVVDILLKTKANVNHKRKTGATALYCASQNGHVKVVQLLIRGGASLNSTKNNNWTALVAACSNGHVKVVELLLQAGVNLEVKTENGSTALIIACEYGHDEVVQLLIDAGANKDAQTNEGDTGLIKASVNNHENVVKVLIKAGANVNIKNKNIATALYAACELGHVEVAERLIRAGADMEIQSIIGSTALHVACEQGRLAILQLFIRAGCNRLLDAQSLNGMTALHFACANNHLEVSELLIQSGTSLDIKTFNGETALMTASEQDHLKIVKLLVQAGANVNLQNEEQRTALFFASSKGHIKTVKYLVQEGADANIKDENSNTPFDIASLNGHEEVCDYFRVF